MTPALLVYLEILLKPHCDVNRDYERIVAASRIEPMNYRMLLVAKQELIHKCGYSKYQRGNDE